MSSRRFVPVHPRSRLPAFSANPYPAMATPSSRRPPPPLAVAPSLDGASAALHESVHRGNPGGVTRALRRGADVNSLHPGTGETALMLAGRLGDPKIVGLLLKAGASVSATSAEEYTALHTAGLGGNAAVVAALLAAGASVSSRTRLGDTPFVSAALLGHRRCAELMLAAGADVDAADHGGRTGLMWAATPGRTEMVAALLAAGAAHGLVDDKGAQALHNATEHEQLGCMAALLRAGADPSAARTSGRHRGETPLHMAARGREHFNGARLLLRGGACAHAHDSNGFTPLLCAASDGYTRMLAMILSFVRRRDDGEDVGAGASALSAGATATALATSRRRCPPQPQPQVGDWSVGPLMRKALSARNHDGWTALHMAAMVYDLGSVNLLLSYGALETEEDGNFHTPFL